MNIHWDPVKRKGLYGARNVGIHAYRSGRGQHLAAGGKTLKEGYSAKPAKYKKGRRNGQFENCFPDQ